LKEYNQFINGAFVKSTSSETKQVLNPCTEEVLSPIPKGYVADANQAMEAAQHAGYLHKDTLSD
jgi:lactaldehyde dehydrogenase/glycolaldehyde dehydrogenase